MAILVHHILEQLLKSSSSSTNKIKLVSRVEILIIFNGRKASHLHDERHKTLYNASASLLFSVKYSVHLPTAQLLPLFFPLHPIVTFCSLSHILPTRLSTDDGNYLLLVTLPSISFLNKALLVWWKVKDKEVKSLEIYTEDESCDLKYILVLCLYFNCPLLTHSFSGSCQRWLIKDLVFPLQFLKTFHQTSPNLDDSDLLSACSMVGLSLPLPLQYLSGFH